MKRTTVIKEISCNDDYDPNSLPVEQALDHIISSINPLTESESINIHDALGRITASDIMSSINVPSGTNSAMDGYAINSKDIPEDEIRTLEIVGSAFAGKPYRQGLKPGECIRIMTGAILPEKADTVVMQEHAELKGNSINIDHTINAGENVRRAGEDIAKGDTVLVSGTRLNPADIGLVASLGIGKIDVIRNIKVAFFSTGDELRSIGESLEDGMIYDSNRYTLHAMLSRLGVEIIDMGVIKDNKDDLQAAFEKASSTADVLITTGGVSVGEADYVKEILGTVGTVNFWKVAMKPGRPLAYGKINNTCFFGLPGNPVSVMVTFYEFVQTALRHMMGEKNILDTRVRVRCISKLRKRPGRMEYQRGILEYDTNQELVVRKTGAQGSGILRSMSMANCFIILPMDAGNIEPGSIVEVQPFFGLI